MQLAEAEEVLQVLSAAHPAFLRDNPATAELYMAALTTRVHSKSVGMEAAQQIITTQLYFPKIAELLETCREVAQHRQAAGRRGERELNAEPPLSHEENAERLRALREQMPNLIRRAE